MSAAPLVSTRLLNAETSDLASIIPAIAEDGSLYPIEKMDAHRRGVQHLAVSVFVFSGDELLLQRRADTKYHCGGLWANTCCTHPYWNETAEASARRRLKQEMGLDLALKPGALIDYEAEVSGGLRENERVRIFSTQIDRRSVTPELNPEEVSHARWSPLSAIRRDVAEAPQAYAPWFRIYLSRWSELGL